MCEVSAIESIALNGPQKKVYYCQQQPWPERLLLADSVEKVGHGFHGRKVRA
jgi:hypothetical protein